MKYVSTTRKRKLKEREREAMMYKTSSRNAFPNNFVLRISTLSSLYYLVLCPPKRPKWLESCH